VGNIDAPDARCAGPKVPNWMIPALYTQDELKAQKKSKVDPAHAVVWRCIGSKVWLAFKAITRSAARPTKR
jgi:hypothetical protein